MNLQARSGEEITAISISRNVLRVCALAIRSAPKRLDSYSASKAMKADNAAIWRAMRRLEEAGWLTSELERRSPTIPRPQRRLFRLTELGERESRKMLAEFQIPRRAIGRAAAAGRPG